MSAHPLVEALLAQAFMQPYVRKRRVGSRWPHDQRGQYMAAKVGRNAPCPCGSGEKHKRCHG